MREEKKGIEMRRDRGRREKGQRYGEKVKGRERYMNTKRQNASDTKEMQSHCACFDEIDLCSKLPEAGSPDHSLNEV
ncbi:hypothetical protein TNCV_1663921 [Trichonephila clavipes]|uniref:Uncharacterized protein n=1 Tax=Trichonephila clavipes TaxID=2585209 RepID=A0A8X6VA10_TRICX|nr:hypothetical protein TNCV_1663921 [Trichonephila clavipes]